MTVVNLAKHHKRPFTTIEGIEWPFFIIFFALVCAVVVGAWLAFPHERFPNYREQIVAVMIAATVIFEIAGPICTRMALDRIRKSGTVSEHDGDGPVVHRIE